MCLFNGSKDGARQAFHGREFDNPGATTEKPLFPVLPSLAAAYCNTRKRPSRNDLRNLWLPAYVDMKPKDKYLLSFQISKGPNKGKRDGKEPVAMLNHPLGIAIFLIIRMQVLQAGLSFHL